MKLSKVLNLINQTDIKNFENINLPIQISPDNLNYRLLIKNTLMFYSNPVLEIKLNSDKKIDFKNILNSVELKIGGQVIDKLTRDEINVYQHKYDLKPKQVKNTIIYPISIDCLNNQNAMFIPKETYFEHWIDIRFAMDVSKIMSCNLNIDNIFFNEDYNLSNLIHCYYCKMASSHIHCNKYYPDSFSDYCDLIKTESDVRSVYSPDNNSSLFEIKKTQKCENQVLNKDCSEINLYFLHDVQNVYFQLNNVETCKIHGEKWFDYITIEVNNKEVLKYDYETIVKHSKKLPKGVFEVEGFENINFNISDVKLKFHGIKLENLDKYELSCFCETINYFINGKICSMMFSE